LQEVEIELKIANELNPGPWIDHSINTGKAAKYISEKVNHLDHDKAYILGTLHDIGRRVGIVSIPKHVCEGYKYSMTKGWDEIAQICMTHSYPIKEDDFNHDLNSDEQVIFEYIKNNDFDDYDRLIQLCDALALSNGFCLIEKRFVDVTRRYGVTPTTIQRWDKTFEIKEYFEHLMGCSIYNVLPDVKETTFAPLPKWSPRKSQDNKKN